MQCRSDPIQPLAGDDVGWLIDSAGPELFLFSSDYPHPERSRDPVGKFEATLGGVDEAATGNSTV